MTYSLDGFGEYLANAEYKSLRDVLLKAYSQARVGKGKERHAVDGERFENQLICEITRRVGLGFSLGQAIKKIVESQVLETGRGMDELLGAINYIAAAYIVMGESIEEDEA